jgi:cystathionine beta-lyase/cystathionine gamma-synthase
VIPAGIFFLAFGVVGVLYGWTGLSVAKNPPRSHTAGASRARSMARIAPTLLRVSVGFLAIGVLLLGIGLTLQ